MLQESVRDHGHQSMAVKAAPGAALEVVKAQPLLHLLVDLLAHPARLDGGGEVDEGGSGLQVGQIVFALAGGSPLAHQPSLLSRHVLMAFVVDALGRAVGDADAAGGKARAQGPFGAAPPGDFAPSSLGQHRLGGCGELVGDLVLPRPAASRHREDERDIGWIDLLMLRIPTAQVRPRALRPWRKDADSP